MNSDNRKMGYVGIYRSLTEHHLWQEKPFARGQASSFGSKRAIRPSAGFAVDRKWLPAGSEGKMNAEARRLEFIRQVSDLLKASDPEEQRQILKAIKSWSLRRAVKKEARQ